MEDSATAEISRSQSWQWIHQDRVTSEGDAITRDYVVGLMTQVLGEVARFDGDRFDDAAEIFREVALRDEFPAFLTVPAYARYLACSIPPPRDCISPTRRLTTSAVSWRSCRLAEIGRAPVCTPVTNAHLVCRLLL